MAGGGGGGGGGGGVCGWTQVLGNIQNSRIEGSGPTVLAVGAGYGYLAIVFTYHVFFLLLSGRQLDIN